MKVLFHKDAFGKKHKLSEFKEWIVDKIWDVRSFFRSKYEMLCRMAFWAWHMRWSWDFDAHTIYQMTYLKLKKIHECMLNHGHCVWNSDPLNNRMRKLAEAKVLAKRLADDDYDMAAWYETEDRYGHKSWTTPVDGGKYHQYHSTWIKNPKQAEIFYKARTKHHAARKKTDLRRYHYLLEKYSRQWWD